MTIGTRSVLYGAHAFWLHPWYVALAWWRLYGFPWDPRLWLAFVLHDLGYLGKPNMDGPEGERHPELGAGLMAALCGLEWGDFVLLHSRHYAKALGRPYSRLCVADKLAFALTPAWLYLPMVRATGELTEYMARAEAAATAGAPFSPRERLQVATGTERAWLAAVQSYCARWAAAHRDGAVDTWTVRERVPAGGIR